MSRLAAIEPVSANARIDDYKTPLPCVHLQHRLSNRIDNPNSKSTPVTRERSPFIRLLFNPPLFMHSRFRYFFSSPIPSFLSSAHSDLPRERNVFRFFSWLERVVRFALASLLIGYLAHD